MTILRIRKKENNFLIIDKTCLTQADLSWGAKGLHSYLMSLPPDWQVNVDDLKKRSTNGRDSVRALLGELEAAGYIVKEWARNKNTGKYSSLEYIVHELPQASHSESPGPGKPSPGFPAPGNPSPEKPPQVNINNNKYLKNKIITAAAREDCRVDSGESESKEAAAVFFEKEKEDAELTFMHQAVFDDSVIGEALTPFQLERADYLTQAVLRRGFHVPMEEIAYCLLNPQHFKGSGQDFGRKLNAIRTVILRGDWQRPAGMVIEEKERASKDLYALEAQFISAQAEVNHFQKKLLSASESAKENIAMILTVAQQKMEVLGCRLKEVSG